MRALLTSQYFTSSTTLKTVSAVQHAQQHPEYCHQNEERLSLLQLVAIAVVAFAEFQLNLLLAEKIFSICNFIFL